MCVCECVESSGVGASRGNPPARRPHSSVCATQRHCVCSTERHCVSATEAPLLNGEFPESLNSQFSILGVCAFKILGSGGRWWALLCSVLNNKALGRGLKWSHVDSGSPLARYGVVFWGEKHNFLAETPAFWLKHQLVAKN